MPNPFAIWCAWYQFWWAIWVEPIRDHQAEYLKREQYAQRCRLDLIDQALAKEGRL